MDLWLAVLLIGLTASAAFFIGAWFGTSSGYQQGAADYEHHLRYPVLESHRHYPAGPWDKYRPPQ